MSEKNEIMNNIDYEVINSRSKGIQISGIDIATELVAVIPNAVTAPFHRYHEVEVKKEIVLKAMEHQTVERDKICDTIVELAKQKELDQERFQLLMVGYGIKRI